MYQKLKLLLVLLLSLSSCLSDKDNKSVILQYNLEISTDSTSFYQSVDQTGLSFDRIESEWTRKQIDSFFKTCLCCERKSDSIITGYAWSTIFEDSIYKVKSMSLGEFGGNTVIEKNGKRDSVFLAYGPVDQVLKHNDSFYLMRSLAHMLGISSVIRIDGFDNLPKISVDTLCMNHERNGHYWSDTFPTFQSIGTTILDTSWALLSHCWFEGQHLHTVYSNDNNTFHGLIENKSLRILDTLAHIPTWTYQNLNYSTIKNKQGFHYKFRNNDFIGSVLYTNDTFRIAFKPYVRNYN